MKIFVILLFTFQVLLSANCKRWIPLMPHLTPNPQLAPLRTFLAHSKQETILPVRGTKTVANCGISTVTVMPNSKIVNGNEAVPHSYPWQVALYIDFIYFCGGSLISDEWVMTAAHCTAGSQEIKVVMGAHNLSVAETTQVSMISRNIITHPSYGASVLRNDVGLVHLPASVVLSSAINPICLPSYSDVAIGEGVMLKSSGWGITSDDPSQEISETLYEVINPTISNTVCIETYGLTITDKIICTNTSSGNKGTCSGDSGGPLMMNVEGKMYSRGVLSFTPTEGCESGLPDGSTRTIYFLSWIETTTGIIIDNNSSTTLPRVYENIERWHL